MNKQNNPKGRENELVIQDLKGELLLYDLKIDKAYCLNPTSAAIWNLCDGNNSVSDISIKLSRKLKQPVTDDLVYLALDQFKEDDLLADGQKIVIKFDGLSRREVIRKVGLASMIALPVIASLAAPTAAMAQSGCVARQGTCSTSADCCSSSPNCNLFGGDGVSRCCVGTGATPSGFVIVSTSTTETCATLTCDSSGLSARCCSNSATTVSCTDNNPRAGISRIDCTCT